MNHLDDLIPADRVEAARLTAGMAAKAIEDPDNATIPGVMADVLEEQLDASTALADALKRLRAPGRWSLGYFTGKRVIGWQPRKRAALEVAYLPRGFPALKCEAAANAIGTGWQGPGKPQVYRSGGRWLCFSCAAGAGATCLWKSSAARWTVIEEGPTVTTRRSGRSVEGFLEAMEAIGGAP